MIKTASLLSDISKLKIPNIKLRSGIVGIERSIQEQQKATDESISIAFKDLDKLMAMAKDMVKISRTISTKIKVYFSQRCYWYRYENIFKCMQVDIFYLNTRIPNFCKIQIISRLIYSKIQPSAPQMKIKGYEPNGFVHTCPILCSSPGL